MAEEAVRTRNHDKAQEVMDLIYQQALDGHEPSQKLVWQSVMSKGSVDDRTQAQEKVVIQIGSMKQQKSEKGITIDNEEIVDEQEPIE